MRCQLAPQSSMFHYFSPGSSVPADHPLRCVNIRANRALTAISGEADLLYPATYRPLTPPEGLLNGQSLIAPHSVRSNRQFCEQLGYSILFRRLLAMDPESVSLAWANLSRLRERLVATDIGRGFFDDVVRFVRRDNLPSSDNVIVDGTLIQSWASFKSFKRKDGEPPNNGGDGARMVAPQGDKPSNSSHRSSTDPDSDLTRKSNGPCVDALVTESTQAERSNLTHARQRRSYPQALGGRQGLQRQRQGFHGSSALGSNLSEYGRNLQSQHATDRCSPPPPAPRALESTSASKSEWKRSSGG